MLKSAHELKLLGTLITGSPRSGTTLALRVLCEGLTTEEVKLGATHNEPGELWDWCINWNNLARDIPTEINSKLPAIVKRSRHNVIKSPHATTWFSFLEPLYHVIFTFRDLRLIVASMLNHEPTQRHGLTATPYWAPMLTSKQDIGAMNCVQRALMNAQLFIVRGLDYKGKMDIWNYGFWDEWSCYNKSITNLYPQPLEDSQRVVNDVTDNNALFSNVSFTLDTWEQAREQFKITNDDAEAVCAMNRELVQLYRDRGFNAKTLDDKGSSMAEQPILQSTSDSACDTLSPLTDKLLQRIEDTWGKPECPTDWIPLPSQRRWEYETSVRLLNKPEGARVLDAGGGQGYLSYILARSHDVTFNDRHDCYKQPVAPVQKIIGSFFTLPETNPYDAIVCVSVLEHVPPEDRARWFEKMYKLLRPGGVAVLTFEWHEDIVFDIGDGFTLIAKQVDELCKGTQLRLITQLTSPIKAVRSRGWLPLALQFSRAEE